MGTSEGSGNRRGRDMRHAGGGGETPSPKKQLGQHFLHDPSILGRIVELSGVGADEAVLEIGPGPGGLTGALLGVGARVTAIETDPRMVEHLRPRFPALTLLHADALQVDYEALAQEAGAPFALVANLPYNISGPLTARLIAQRRAFRSMTLMYQKEVAERITAPTGVKARGGLSVWVQTFCDVRVVMHLPPGAFKPPPKVDSAVVRFTFRSPPPQIDDEARYHRLIQTSFQGRRKMLRNTLRRHLAEDEDLFARCGLEGTERPENLSVAQWIALDAELRKRTLSFT